MLENENKSPSKPLFTPGGAGGPGRPPGLRNAATKLLDVIGEESAEEVLGAVVQRAKEGDLAAAEIILKRVWPVPKTRKLQTSIPEVSSAADTLKATARVLEQVASGELRPDEGQALAGLLETYRKGFEIVELEERLRRLEEAVAKK
jgi:hypothetical protein